MSADPSDPSGAPGSSGSPGSSPEPTPPPDDTAAFSRFYLGVSDGSDAQPRGLLYRVFVGWWRDR